MSFVSPDIQTQVNELQKRVNDLEAANTEYKLQLVEKDQRLAVLQNELDAQANNHAADNMAQARKFDFFDSVSGSASNAISSVAKKLSYQLNITIMQATKLALGCDEIDTDKLIGRCSSRNGDKLDGNPATTYFLDGEAILIISNPVASGDGLDLEMNLRYQMLGKAAAALKAKEPES